MELELELPKEAKTLVGSVAECELSCEKLRTDDAVRTVASGDFLGVASRLELRSSPEAVVAASRVRGAIVVRLDASDDDDVGTREAPRPSANVCSQPPTAALCNLPLHFPSSFLRKHTTDPCRRHTYCMNVSELLWSNLLIRIYNKPIQNVSIHPQPRRSHPPFCLQRAIVCHGSEAQRAICRLAFHSRL